MITLIKLKFKNINEGDNIYLKQSELSLVGPTEKFLRPITWQMFNICDRDPGNHHLFPEFGVAHLLRHGPLIITLWRTRGANEFEWSASYLWAGMGDFSIFSLQCLAESKGVLV